MPSPAVVAQRTNVKLSALRVAQMSHPPERLRRPRCGQLQVARACCRLDEQRVVIDPTPAAELEDLLNRARPLAVDPFKPARKWWQFWRS